MPSFCVLNSTKKSGGGVLPQKWGVGGSARFLKPLPYFRPKSVIFPTLFQTWSKLVWYPISDLKPRSPARDRSAWQAVTGTYTRIDCKTVGFFLKISKEIGKAWRISASFQTFCLTARPYLNTQKYELFCSLGAVMSLSLGYLGFWCLLVEVISFRSWCITWKRSLVFISAPFPALPLVSIFSFHRLAVWRCLGGCPSKGCHGYPLLLAAVLGSARFSSTSPTLIYCWGV